MQGNTYTQYYTMVFAQRVSLKWAPCQWHTITKNFFYPQMHRKTKIINGIMESCYKSLLENAELTKNKKDQWNDATNLSFKMQKSAKNKIDQWNDATNLSLKMQKSPKNKNDQWNHATNLSLKMQKSPKNKIDQWNHATNLSLKMQMSPKTKMINGITLQISR